ncbi:uncharacterized protein LOC119165524 isoform X3 [Rhipicephalus microplus]|uniref:uncharacterized protein LOC119165524 isoform X3 n=1 Tax=Rhipicephalus microplus TaxID=6941 RepID=UPI003F6CC03B
MAMEPTVMPLKQGSQGHTATDSAPSDLPEDAPSGSECDALPACSTACSAGVETTHELSCQPFQALTVPVESQQNFCAACGGFLSAEGTADVTGSSSSSWDADQAVVAALHKRIATLEECLNNMKRKVATLQQQKSRANRRNHELSRETSRSTYHQINSKACGLPVCVQSSYIQSSYMFYLLGCTFSC